MKTNHITEILLIVSLILCVVNAEALMPEGKEDKSYEGMPEYVPGEVLVKFKEGVMEDVQEAVELKGARSQEHLSQKLNIKVKNIERLHSIKPAAERYRKEKSLKADESNKALFKEAYKEMSPKRKALYRKYKITLAEDISVEEAISKLRDNPDVEDAQPNYIRRIYAFPDDPPNDPYLSSQWGLYKIDALDAWKATTTGSPDIVIAVIDTGVDYSHADLSGNIWRDEYGNPGADFVDIDTNAYIQEGFTLMPEEDYTLRDTDPMDVDGHGTHCSGIAAAVTNNGIGIAGVTSHCKIMPVRAGFTIMHPQYGEVGLLEDDDIAVAIMYAIENGTDVISMSWGSYAEGALVDEIKAAYAENIVLVAAAGNDNTSQRAYPASMDEVIAVSATDSNDNKASFSNYGDWIEVAAPGLHILSTVLGDSYVSLNGTSMACPHVSGLAALVFSTDPGLLNEEVRRRIQAFSDDIGEVGRDDFFGYGRINAYWSCKGAHADVSIDSPGDRDFIRDEVDITGSAFIETGFVQYQLYYAPKESPEDLILIVSSDESVEEEFLTLPGEPWDTTERPDGSPNPDGEHILTLKVINDDGKAIFHSIEVTIDNINQPPIFDITRNKGVVLGRPLEFEVAHDPDDPETPAGQLYFSSTTLPDGASMDPATGRFCWTPLNAGSYDVTFTVQDSEHIREKAIILTTAYLETTQITFASNIQQKPIIYRDKIVWEDWRSGGISGSDIYMYDLSSGAETPITNSRDSRESNPGFYGDIIAWEDYRNDRNYPDIYMYDMSSGQENPVAIGPPNSRGYNRQINPFVYEGKIFWSDERSGDYNLYMYNAETSAETLIIGAAGDQYRPHMHGNRIIWQDGRNTDSDFDIYMLDLDSGEERCVINGPNRDGRPQIYEDKIVWNEYYYEDGAQYNWVYDITTGKKTQINILPMINKYFVFNPVIYGDRVVWTGPRNGYHHIFMYDIPTDLEIQITIGLNWNSAPHIFGNKIAWTMQPDGAPASSQDIYMARVFLYPQITSVNPGTVPQGSLIAITGRNFGYPCEESQVVFANGAEGVVESWTNTEISCRVPANAETGPLRVITLGGESNGIEIVIGSPTSTVSIIDDGEPGFTTSGYWKYYNQGGFRGDCFYSAKGNGNNITTWTFEVEPGAIYHVYATWFGHPNRATDAPFTIKDGGAIEETVRVNQEPDPGDVFDEGVGWRRLGTYSIESNALTVQLSNDANEYVIADGVRIEIDN